MVSNSNVIDYQKIDELEDLPSPNGDDFVSSLVSKYLSLLPVRLETLHALSIQGDHAQIRREVHSFKLSCQILGAEGLSHCLAEVAVFAQNGDQNSLQVALVKASIAAQAVVVELNHFLSARVSQKERAG